AATNMFVRDGLRHHAPRVSAGAAKLLRRYADRVDADWRALKYDRGYREYYDQAGRGGGEGPFFWDCLRRTTFSVRCALGS
ncbi:MAG TPA: hypothetical protein VFA70_14535, partial [Dehalococcoidia bacterium]|nr:hypothetical protein [Dehalococcoidia bacterium]